uniref:Uncharacterized protein n=1 Tax=Strigamia maritima TaxID=126957 RepID=T1IWE0_STRMM
MILGNNLLEKAILFARTDDFIINLNNILRFIPESARRRLQTNIHAKPGLVTDIDIISSTLNSLLFRLSVNIIAHGTYVFSLAIIIDTFYLGIVLIWKSGLVLRGVWCNWQCAI